MVRPVGRRAAPQHGLEPVTLAEKEGLALINGTDGMLGMLLLACTDLDALLRTADITAAMSVEALLGTDRVFAADLQALRPQPGQARRRGQPAGAAGRLADRRLASRARLRPRAGRLLAALRARRSPAPPATPLAHARLVAGVRAARRRSTTRSCTLDGRVESNGNFHGAPVAYVLDFLAIPTADVASISERRTDRMLDAARSRGLPPFLADDPGVDSGPHDRPVHPGRDRVANSSGWPRRRRVDSIPSSAMQEDHVSMGWSAARKLRRAVDGLSRVLAIELLTAARALELRAPLTPGPATGAVVAALREHRRPGPGPIASWPPEIEAAVAFVQSGAAVAAANQVDRSSLREELS